MKEIVKFGLLCSGAILLLVLYVRIIVCQIQERGLYKKMKNIYIRKLAFLRMENDGNLLSLTIEKEGFEARTHYFSSSKLVLRAESGGFE